MTEYHPERFRFNEQLRELREGRGIPQSEFANMLGVHIDRFEGIEAGRLKPPRQYEFYGLIQEALKLTPEEFGDLMHREGLPKVIIQNTIRTAQVTEEGIQVGGYLDPNTFSEEALDQLADEIKAVLKIIRDPRNEPPNQ